MTRLHLLGFKFDDVLKSLENMFVLCDIVSIKISEIIYKINFCHPKIEIPYWNEMNQSECCFTI